jgi:endonuclease I
MNFFILIGLLISITVTTQAHASLDCGTRWDNYLAHHSLERRFQKLRNKCNEEFITTLNNIIKAHHKKTGYREARQYMFSHLDNVNGEVCGVYTQECIYTDHIPSSRVMNCEHSWPKSRGAAKGMAKYDLHHLYPTKSDINSMRSSYPFCELKNRENGRHGSYLGKSIRNNRTRCFEPRDEHKGDLARAMFYFSVRYKMHIDSDQEFFFRKWNRQDPIDDHEKKRDLLIKDFQGNQNPFITHPQFINFIDNF